MKQSKLIATAIVLATIGSGSVTFAETTVENTSPALSQEQLAQFEASIEFLSQSGALSADSEGNVRLKPGIINQLREAGRLTSRFASGSGLCN